MLKKFLNPGHSPLTVAMVETAWQEFILNRSQSALAGVPPHDYKTVSQKVTEVSVSSLASSHQSLQAEVAELQNKLKTTSSVTNLPSQVRSLSLLSSLSKIKGQILNFYKNFKK